jgi:phosphomannomutase/phosphoglucomutase
MYSQSIFRAYDIRGVYLQEFDEKGAEDIGKAYASYLLFHSKSSSLQICIGRDGRTHSQEISEAFVRGVLSTGVSVVDTELSFSPLLYFSTCFGKFDGGVMITASHNPKEYNGFKFQGEQAHALFGEQLQEILDILEEKRFVESELPGMYTKDSFLEEYVHKLKTLVPGSYSAKIVIDAGNGVAGSFAPEIFRQFGFTVEELYCELDGTFPNHIADPENEETLKDLQNQVVLSQADFGLAFDGDGDRIGLVSSDGKIYSADMIFLLLIRDIALRVENPKVVCNVSTSSLASEEIEKNGGVYIPSRVGHSYIENTMRAERAVLGGENSGHFFFAENYYGFDDAVLAGLRLISYVLESKKPLSDHFKNLPPVFTSPEYKIELDDVKKFAVEKALKERFKKEYPCDFLDGVKIDFGNKEWAIARVSNTKPELKFRIEARTKESLEKYTKLMREAILEEVKKI